MKLKKLRLQNYRVHEDSTLPISDASLVIVRGRNMSGKTSFAEALSMNLASTTVSLPGDGKGFVKKISQGESKAVITAELETEHLFINTVTLNVNTSGRTGEVKCIDAPDDKDVINEFKNWLTDKKSAILIATNTEYFVKLDDKSQTDLLAKLVLPPRHDFPQDKVQAVIDALGTGIINFDGEPFEVITKSYKALYKERETVNRQVKEFKIPDALPIPKGVDSSSINAELAKIKEQRTKLQKERDEAVKKANEIEVKRATLQTKIDGLKDQVVKGKKRLEELEADQLEFEDLGKLNAIIAKADELAKLKTEHAGIHNSRLVHGKEIERFTEILEQGKTCPVCDQDIDEAKFKAALEEIKEEYAGADHKIQELDKKIESIGDIAAAKESLRKHDAAVKEAEGIEADLLTVVATGKATRAELVALPEATNATLPFNDPLGALQAQEDSLNDQLRPVIAAEERKNEIKRLTEQKDKLVAKAATLDTLTKYFDKDGVKAELIGQYIGGFESKINTVMDAFGCKTSLTFEPQTGFDVTTSRGYTGPIKELCGAESEIFKRAFQCAVSIAAGINMVVLDEMEELGSDIRPMLFRSIFSLIQGGLLEQAILIEFSLDKTVPAKEKRAPGSKYFYISDGTVEELK